MNIQQTISRSTLCLLGLLLFACPVAAQVNGAGPSDPASFDFVKNVPPDPDIGNDGRLGGTGFTSQLNISDGGKVGEDFNARAGGEVNISGGSVGDDFDAFSGSEVNISGGSVGENFVAFGGEVRISGGSLGPNFRALSNSNLELIGGEFELNGLAFTGATISLGEFDTFTGTLADGSAFIFSEGSFQGLSFIPHDSFSDAQLTPAVLPAADLFPILVSTSNPNLPSGLRAGQTLTLQGDGQLGENFELVNATLNVQDGSLGDYPGAVNSEVNVSDGSVGDNFHVRSGSVVNISGGSVGGRFFALSSSEVNISGGSIGRSFGAVDSVVNMSSGSIGGFSGAGSGSVVNVSGGLIGFDFDAGNGSVVNISGGSVGSGFDANFGSEVNISGGSVGGGFRANDGSEVNLFGSDFALDGVSLDSLTIDEAFAIVDRNVTLSGLYVDGTAFSVILNPTDSGARDFFDRNATVTVTLVSPVILGDANLDGVVDFADIAPFIAVLQSGIFLEQADCNQDGVVDFGDIASFIAILQGS